jgi:hypothetical protein
MTSTAHDAQPIFLEWTDDEDCKVDGLEQLEPRATVTKPVRFIAGKNWRFLGTFNPVDAQRVFKLGQALGRRFRRVPVPPPHVNRFEALLLQRAASLEPAVRAAIVQIYKVHDDFEPPLGAAPFLDLCEYLLTAATITSGAAPAQDNEATDTADDHAHEETTDVEAEPGADDTDASPRLAATTSRLLAEAYVASLGTWLAQLTPVERANMRSRLVRDVFSSSDWAWLERMFRSL